MDIQGRIKFISQSEFLGANSFQKRDLVISTQETYPQHITIQFTQDKCALLDSLQVGQLVRVHFNLRGREWVNPQGEIKYFNTVEGWKVEIVQVTNVANQGYQNPSHQNPSGQAPLYQNPQQPQQTSAFNSYGQAPAQNQEDDEMPF
ncbi:hypothetical protein CAPN001_11690 [Capnocytophaga stomatis]|uniref:DUF3127 domain-containing protein n=1 Tax=Capnocytophaga stomatis TaxID=1848904 RepID=UPI0019524C2C|nr:DUF3127 domain-containing protein [Capnocytophaga stomatis]GIJ96600.1 hypothetical protein CAPN001_11690 [Capnocytophaga stomatis]